MGGLKQEEISYRGWAMQLRVTLMPGKEQPISKYSEPNGPGIRIDSAVEEGRKPSSQYDPLIAKIICSVPEGKTFDDCIIKALSVLDSFKLEGVRTNIHILKNILQHPDFQKNNVLTS